MVETRDKVVRNPRLVRDYCCRTQSSFDAVVAVLLSVYFSLRKQSLKREKKNNFFFHLPFLFVRKRSCFPSTRCRLLSFDSSFCEAKLLVIVLVPFFFASFFFFRTTSSAGCAGQRASLSATESRRTTLLR